MTTFTKISTTVAALALTGGVSATTLSTTFSTSDGFATGQVATPYTFGAANFQVTFTGFQQRQSFDGPAYSTGPEALFAINGGFTGSFGSTVSDNSDIATIDFSSPASFVSFFAADRANGTPSIRAFDALNNILTTVPVSATSNASGATALVFDSAILGGSISRIEIDNAGPAANPPYVTAIDNFSATAVPEPSTSLLGILGAAAFFLRRKRA